MNQKQSSARPLVEGAMLAVITVLLSFIPIATALIPVPIIILVYRYDLRLGILSAITASLLAGMITGVVTGFVPLLIVGFVGVAIGGALLEGFSPNRTLLVGTIAFLVSLTMTLAFSSFVLGENLISLFLDSIEKGFHQAAELSEKFGTAGPLEQLGPEGLEGFMKLIRVLLPGMFVASSMLMTFFNYWVARVILNRTGASLEWFPPFKVWRFPWYLSWGYIIGQFLMVLTQYVGANIIVSLGANLQLLFTYLFQIQGLAIAWFFFEKGNIAKPFRFIILFFVLFNPMLGTLLTLAGVLDTWFNFRKLEVTEGKE